MLKTLFSLRTGRASLAISGRGRACSAARADMDRTGGAAHRHHRRAATLTTWPRAGVANNIPETYKSENVGILNLLEVAGFPPGFNCLLLDQMPVLLVGLER